MRDPLKSAFKRAVINCSEFFNSPFIIPYFRVRNAL